MNKRRWIILLVSLGVIAFLVVAVSASAVLAYTVVKVWPQISINSANTIALAQKPAEHENGILVASVSPDSPAEQAGIVRGDIILEANGQEVNTPSDLQKVTADLEAGDEVQLTVLHGDDLKNVTISLEDGETGLLFGIISCPAFPMEAFSLKFEGSSGVFVSEVVEGGPADMAGLRMGNLITAVGGTAIDAENTLPELLAAYKPGDEVTLSIQRSSEGEIIELQVTLGEHPDDATKAYLGIQYKDIPHFNLGEGGELPFRMPFNDQLPEMPFDHLPEGIRAGAIIGEIAAGSPAEEAGLQAGVIITAVDNDTIDSPKDLVQAIREHKPGDEITLSVIREGQEDAEEVVVTLGENPDNAGTAYLGVSVSGFSIQTNPEEFDWFDQLPIPKDFELPFPHLDESPPESEGGA